MAKRTGQNAWDWDARKALQFLVCEEGFTPKMAARELSVSDTTVYSELKRGLIAEEYLHKRYSKYRPERALCEDAVAAFGQEELSIILENFQDFQEEEKE